MWRRSIKYYFRILSKNKFYTFLNVTGLALGICIGIVISLYVNHELSFDKHYKNHKNIYRVSSHFSLEQEVTMAMSGMGLGPLMKAEFNQVESFVRLGSLGENLFLKHNQNVFYEDHVFFTDSNYFDLFETEFIAGDPGQCLKNERSIVVTQSFAKRVFGVENPMGEIVKTNNNWFEVTAVIKDIPENSHLRFSALLPAFKTSISEEDMASSLWMTTLFTYLKLKVGSNPKNIEYHFDAFYNKYMANMGEALNGNFSVRLERIDKVHLSSLSDFDLGKGSVRYLMAFVSIGIVILLLAIINYVNMATARIPVRAKEAGVRKILGSRKKELMLQFMGESVILSFIALIIALSATELLVNAEFFKDLLRKDLSVQFSKSLIIWIGGPLLALIVGVASGYYPALKIASVQTISALKGLIKMNRRATFLRTLLVGFQVTVSVTLVVVALTMAQQIEFMNNKDLGFSKNNILLIPIQDSLVAQKINAQEKSILAVNGVQNFSSSYTILGSTVGKSVVSLDSLDAGNKVVDYMVVGNNYFKTMEMKFISGHSFNLGASHNPMNEVVVNKAFMEEMGWVNLEDRYIFYEFDNAGVASNRSKVVGVVQDFNAFSLRDKIRPLVFYYQTMPYGSLHVRLSAKNMAQTLDELTLVWKKIDPKRPLEYSFLNEGLNKLYAEDQRLSNFIKLLTIIAIFISGMGLLSLASFTTRKRTKELAMRKVLGATQVEILVFMLKDISKIILVSCALAIPLSRILIVIWQTNFTVRVPFNPTIYLATILMTYIFMVVTVGYQAFKASTTNPIQALRYE